MVITSTKNNEIIDFSKLTNKLDFDYQLNFFKEEKKKYEIFKKNKDFLEHFVKKGYTINIYIDSENEIVFENSNTKLMHIYTTKTYSKKSNNIVSKYFKSEISEDEFLTLFKDDINKKIFKKENDIKTQFLSDDYSSLFYNHQYLLNILSDIELINLINDDKLKHLYTYGYENFNDAVFEKLYAHTNFKLDERVIEYYASNYKFVSKSLIDKTIFLQTSILINVYADNKASYLLTFADILSNNGVIKYSNSDSSRDGFYFYAQYETIKNDLIGYADILSESNNISTSLFLNKVEENFINKI